MFATDPDPKECRVLLFRHGESVSNKRNYFAGWTDVDLTERGRNQATKLAHRIADIEIDAAYASTLQRATETAEIVVESHDINVTSIDAIKERSYGVLEGRPKSEERAFRDPSGPNRSEWHPPEGESRSDVADRVFPAIEGIADDHSGDTVVIVAHGGVNRTILAGLISGDPMWGHQIAQENTSFNVLTRSDSWSLQRVNDTAHLHP